MKKEQEGTGPKQIIEVRYYNVMIYVEFKGKEDEYLIHYLKELVGGRQKVKLKHILTWCKRHHLNAETKFRYRWDFPPHANLANLITYYRVLWEMDRESE